jgi:hypothetical protein
MFGQRVPVIGTGLSDVVVHRPLRVCHNADSHGAASLSLDTLRRRLEARGIVLVDQATQPILTLRRGRDGGDDDATAAFVATVQSVMRHGCSHTPPKATVVAAAATADDGPSDYEPASPPSFEFETFARQSYGAAVDVDLSGLGVFYRPTSPAYAP